MRNYLKEIKRLGGELGGRMSDEWVADYIVDYITKNAEIAKNQNMDAMFISIDQMPVSPTALKLIQEILEQTPLGVSVHYYIKVTPKNGKKKDYGKPCHSIEISS